MIVLSLFIVYSMGQFLNDHPIMAADAYSSQVESYPGGYWEQYALNKLSPELRQKYYQFQKENGYCLANAALEYYVNKGMPWIADVKALVPMLTVDGLLSRCLSRNLKEVNFHFQEDEHLDISEKNMSVGHRIR